MKTKLLFLILATLFTASCSKEITGELNRRKTNPSVSTKTPIGIKVSPAANIVSGTQVKSRFAITPSNRTVSGAQVKSKFTFHQSRPN